MKMSVSQVSVKRSLRLLLFELTLTVIAMTFLICFLIWCKQSFRFLSFIALQRLGFYEFVHFVKWMIPDLIVLGVPFAFFFAVIVTYLRYEDEQFFLLLRSFGVATSTFFQPVVLLGIGGMGFLWFMSLYVVPHSFREFRKQELFFRSALSKTPIQVGEFKSLGNFVVYAQKKVSDNSFEGVLLYDKKAFGQNAVLMGQKARLQKIDNALQICIENGLRQEISEERVSFFEFKKYVFTVMKENWSYSSKKNYEMSLRELKAAMCQVDLRKSAFAELLGRFFVPLLFFAFGLVAACVMLQVSHKGFFYRFFLSVLIVFLIQALYVLIMQRNDILGIWTPFCLLVVVSAPLMWLSYFMWRERLLLKTVKKTYDF